MVCSPDSYLGDSSLHMLWRSTFKSITETCDKEMWTRQGKIRFVPIFDLLSTFIGPFLDIFILINRRSAIQSTSLTSRLNSSTGNILSNMQDKPLFIMYPRLLISSWVLWLSRASRTSGSSFTPERSTRNPTSYCCRGHPRPRAQRLTSVGQQLAWASITLAR